MSSSIHWGTEMRQQTQRKWIKRAHGHTYNSTFFEEGELKGKHTKPHPMSLNLNQTQRSESVFSAAASMNNGCVIHFDTECVDLHKHTHTNPHAQGDAHNLDTHHLITQPCFVWLIWQAQCVNYMTFVHSFIF